MLRGRFEDDPLQADLGIWSVCFVDDLLEFVVGDDGQAVNCFNAGALAIRQPQTAPDGLFDQNARIGGSQRNDSVEVGHVPALLEHIDVNHDLGWLFGVLHLEQSADHFLFLRSRFAGVHLDHLFLVAAFEKGVGLDEPQQLAGVGGVAGDHEHERLHDSLLRLPSVRLQPDLHVLMEPDAVLQFDLLQFRR